MIKGFLDVWGGEEAGGRAYKGPASTRKKGSPKTTKTILCGGDERRGRATVISRGAEATKAVRVC
jgi:hypothetical protein